MEVFTGNTHDAKTVAGQIAKLRERFRLTQVVLVGDRGTLTSARLREDFPGEAAYGGSPPSAPTRSGR